MGDKFKKILQDLGKQSFGLESEATQLDSNNNYWGVYFLVNCKTYETKTYIVSEDYNLLETCILLDYHEIREKNNYGLVNPENFYQKILDRIDAMSGMVLLDKMVIKSIKDKKIKM